MDKDQQLPKGEVKVASSVVWKQTDDHKVLQGRDLWNVEAAWTWVGRKGGAKALQLGDPENCSINQAFFML